MPKSKSKPNKYANKAPQVFENGFAVTLGGADDSDSVTESTGTIGTVTMTP